MINRLPSLAAKGNLAYVLVLRYRNKAIYEVFSPVLGTYHFIAFVIQTATEITPKGETALTELVPDWRDFGKTAIRTNTFKTSLRAINTLQD